ncbi:hypothetical protein [Streptomyces sp. NPDC058202]|uniref:hypothetical protein n=1 Tax=Streptomyces sp. NPDC058202 TaxID=3346380 RepID=UPI0036ECEEC0
MDDVSDVPRPATSQLLALAAVARPDWSPDHLRDVIAQARYADFTWGRLLVAVAQLIADPEAEPPDLLAGAPEAWRRRRQPIPDTAQRGAAAARAALHNTDTD